MNYINRIKTSRLTFNHSSYFLIFVILLILLSNIISITSNSILTISCFFLISTIGVCHGSLDNLKGDKLLKIYKIKNKSLFYLAYIFLSIIVIIFWLLFPTLALIIFLIIASYHFGKEDTEPLLNVKNKKYFSKWFKSEFTNFVFFLKGMLIVAAPLYFHYQETSIIFKILGSTLGFVSIDIALLYYISILSYIWCIIFIEPNSYGTGVVSFDLASIILLNYFFTPLIAFTLYFCFLHSIRHSISLITMLNKKNFTKGTRIFIKKALPLTLITAVIFILGVFLLTNYYDINNAVLKVIFIGLASLTFPHILLEYLIEKNER
jgi:Brp/Blh family beta-carotene 15,15'-monooxygenase